MTDKAVSELTAASALNDADLILISQSGVSKKLLASALKTYTGGGTVTSVSGTGTVSGISLSGTVTSSGNLTLNGTLDLSVPPAIGGTTPNIGSFTTLIATSVLKLNGATSGFVGLKGASAAGSTTYTLPSADGSNGQVLSTNGTGTLSWTTAEIGRAHV